MILSVSVNFNQAAKQTKVLFGVFLVTANPRDTDLGRNLTVFKGRKKRTAFIKTGKKGLLKGLCKLI